MTAAIEAKAPLTDADKRIALRSHIGIDRLARLIGWALLIQRAFPDAEIVVFGSALHGKDWSDVDIGIMLPQPRYDSIVGSGFRIGCTWDVLAASVSALAQQMCGFRVEARFMSTSFVVDETWTLLAVPAGEHHNGSE